MPKVTFFRQGAAGRALAPDEVRLGDGRIARVRGYDFGHVAVVDALMTAAGYPRTGPLAVGAAVIHMALLVATSIETIDGCPLEWPTPDADAIGAFLATLAPADIETIRARYVATIPAGAAVTLPAPESDKEPVA